MYPKTSDEAHLRKFMFAKFFQNIRSWSFQSKADNLHQQWKPEVQKYRNPGVQKSFQKSHPYPIKNVSIYIRIYINKKKQDWEKIPS